ncbi:MAG: hypothetical protein P8Z80_06300 [Pseudolabrys sp.]
MEWCKDYFYFADWFAGIGYVVLWPLATVGNGGRLFGASLLCSGAGRDVTAALCGLPRPVSLLLGLHLMGLAAAIAVGIRFCWHLLQRVRARLAGVPATRYSNPLPARPSQAPTRRLRTVKPRAHFGLRGTPH